MRNSAATCRWVLGVAVCIAVAWLVVIAAPTTSHAQTPPHLDANGWTVFTASADTRVIYVSSSKGSDSNNGLSPTTPVKTINKGLSLLRQNYPDWLLLKKGDVWTDETLGYIGKKGRSATEPMLIASYGAGARPLIKTNPTTSPPIAIGSIGGTSNGDYLALVGIEFYAYTRDPNSPDYNPTTITLEHPGMRFLNPTTWLLIEDCKFQFYTNNVVQGIGGSIGQAKLRRSVIVNNYATKTHSQGIYYENVDSLVLEENVIDHNGWNANIAGAERTQFNHGLYSAVANRPATVRGNIFARNSSHGATMNNGGEVSDNLFVRNAIALHFKRSPSGESVAARNVIMESDDHSASDPRGWGVTTGTLSDYVGSLLVEHNIVAHVVGSNPASIALASGVPTLVRDNIIFSWPQPVTGVGLGHTLEDNRVDLVGANLFGFPDPSRSVASYDASLGGPGTLEHFLAEAAKQSKDYWRPEYTAKAANEYVRAGFGLREHP